MFNPHRKMIIIPNFLRKRESPCLEPAYMPDGTTKNTMKPLESRDLSLAGNNGMKRSNVPGTYPGLENDINGGMTFFGKIIRDAWVFGILPESETCKDWTFSRIDAISQQVNDEWDKYGCMVSQLPTELRERHQRIYDEAIAHAKRNGWDPDAAIRDEN